MPWKIAEDMELFKKVTTEAQQSKSNAVIMGRKTYESIPAKFRPLTGRINVVLSNNENVRTQLGLSDDVLIASSLTDALDQLNKQSNLDRIFVIGGESVYKEAIASASCSRIYLTEIENEVPDLDTFFPFIRANRFRLSYRSEKRTSGEYSYRFTEYDAVRDEEVISKSEQSAAAVVAASTEQLTAVGNAEEQQYLDHIRDILDNGVLRGDRTGTGTLSKFGVQMRFDLRNNQLPLLTTKRVFWRGVAEELVWFIQGRTNGKELSDKGIHIWDGNGSREFLDSRGLGHREVGDLGPVYGFQWRHFGAEVM